MARRSDHKALERRRLVRHFLEMVAAMLAGMAVLGMAVRLVCTMTGQEGLLEHAGVRAPIMATNMTIGMAAWMRHRGHGWPATADMAAAMYAPMALLLVPFHAGLLSGAAMLGLMHLLMLPAMVVAMEHRRAEYVHVHAASKPHGVLVATR